MMITRAAATTAATVGCIASFAILSAKVRAHRFDRFDQRVNTHLRAIRRSGRPMARNALTVMRAQPMSSIYAYVPMAVLLGAWVALGGRRRDRKHDRIAGSIIGAEALLSVMAVKLLVRMGFYRKPPPSSPKQAKTSYPSDHAFTTSAIAWTTAYLLMRRRRVAPAMVVAPAVAVPLFASAGKLVQGRHWTTDVAGGLLAGAALACAGATAYELGSA